MITETPSDNWIVISKQKNREVFSELDALLRALGRFFNIENLPLSKAEIASKNFFDELVIVRDVILRVVGLLETVIPENRKNVYWFQKFAATKYLNDKKRDAFREELHKQDVPEKSLFLLYDSFINLKGIVTDILKTENIPYITFGAIGQVIDKDLRENVHFNPFGRDLNPEFDVIENRTISKIVRGIKDKDTKKYVSVLLLSLFKFLRYLRHADSSSKFGSLNSSLVILLLLRSEIALFRDHIEKFSGGSSRESLSALMKILSYQFSVESKRVFQQELKGAFTGNFQRLQGALENSHGILKNLSEQSIVQIVQPFKPDVKGSEVFESFTTRLEQSLRLREDLLILQRFLTLVEGAVLQDTKMKAFAALRNFMLYFQSFTFKLLRHDDFEEFSSFFEKVLAKPPTDGGGENFDKLLEKIKGFGIFLEACLGHLGNRAELYGKPADMRHVEEAVFRYLH